MLEKISLLDNLEDLDDRAKTKETLSESTSSERTLSDADSLKNVLQGTENVSDGIVCYRH